MLVAKNPDCLYFGNLPLERCCFYLWSIMSHKHTCFKQMDEKKEKLDLFSLGNIPDITHITSHIVSSRILSHGHAMGEVSNWKTSFLVWLSARRKARSSVDQRRAERELETAKLVSYQLVTLERKGRAFSLNAQNTSDAEVRETQRMIKVIRTTLAWLTKSGGIYSLLQCR